MLKQRLIPKLLLKKSKRGGKDRMVLVTTVNFSEQIEVGDPLSQAKIYQAQAADELIFLDLDRTIQSNRSLITDIIRKIAEEIFMPFTVGGGVRSLDDFRHLLANGADKVAVNTAAIDNPALIEEAASAYGSQCVVLSMDCRQSETGKFKVWKDRGTIETPFEVVEWALRGEEKGAGEILLTSIDRDGTGDGLDIELIRSVAEAVKIPVIASGGCGLAKHFIAGFLEGRADAVSAGTFFCFRDQNPMQARSHIKSAGIPVRLCTYIGAEDLPDPRA